MHDLHPLVLLLFFFNGLVIVSCMHQVAIFKQRGWAWDTWCRLGNLLYGLLGCLPETSKCGFVNRWLSPTSQAPLQMGLSPLDLNHSKFTCFLNLVVLYSAWAIFFGAHRCSFSNCPIKERTSHFKLVAFADALGKCTMWRRWGCLYCLAFWWDLY